MSDRPALVGRATEFDRARAVLTTGHRAGVVMIEGEPGAGKTALIDAALDAVDTHSVTIARDICAPSDASNPFGVLVRMLDCDAQSPDPRRAAVGSLLARGPEGVPSTFESGPGRRISIVEAMLDLISHISARQPLVLVVDDLHWADTGTRAVLDAVVAAGADGDDVVIVGALRPTPDPAGAVASLVEAASSAGDLIRLEPLTPAQAGELIASLTGAEPGANLRRAAAAAGGNPLLLRQLVEFAESRGWLRTEEGVAELTAPDALVPAMSDVLLARLDGVSDAAREALRAASVLGPAISLADVAGLLGRPASALIAPMDELVVAGLVQAGSGENSTRLRFRHDLIREAIYDEIAPWARVALHAQAASLLAARDRAPVDVALHLAKSEPAAGATTAAWFADAGRTLLHTDPLGARRFLDQAFDLSDAPAPELVADLVLAYTWSGASAEGEVLARSALDADAGAASSVRRALAHALFVQGRVVEAADALEAVPAGVPGALRDRADAVLMRAITYQSTTALAEADAVLAASDGDALVRCIALCAKSWAAATLGWTRSAIDLARQAVDAAGTEHEALRYIPSFFLAVALFDAEQFDAYEEVAAAGRSISARIGATWQQPIFSSLVAAKHLRTGDWESARAEADAGLGWSRDTGSQMGVPWLHCYKALVLLWRDDLDAARVHVEAARSNLGDEIRPGFDGVLWVDGLVAEAAGDLAAACAAIGALWDILAGLDLVTRMPLVAPDLMRIALASGDDVRAKSVLAAFEAVADRAPPPNVVADRNSAFDVALQRCRGLYTGDADLIADAARAAAESPAQLERAFAEADAAVALAGAGRDAEARTFSRSAFGIFDALDARYLRRRLQAGLRGAGIPDSALESAATGEPMADDVDDDIARLSPAEVRVAELVADGLSNPEIADRLCVSRRTVESHISHIFTKLDIRSRVDLAVRMRRSA